jgi:hypothetical protein
MTGVMLAEVGGRTARARAEGAQGSARRLAQRRAKLW